MGGIYHAKPVRKLSQGKRGLHGQPHPGKPDASQARNRYTFAASAARKEKLEAVARVFEFTADQERAHAKVFYDLLLPSAGQNIAIDGNYPIDLSDKTLDLLKAARHNEYEEFEHDYAAFAEIAHREGFDLIGGQFQGCWPSCWRRAPCSGRTTTRRCGCASTAGRSSPPPWPPRSAPSAATGRGTMSGWTWPPTRRANKQSPLPNRAGGFDLCLLLLS